MSHFSFAGVLAQVKIIFRTCVKDFRGALSGPTIGCPFSSISSFNIICTEALCVTLAHIQQHHFSKYIKWKALNATTVPKPFLLWFILMFLQSLPSEVNIQGGWGCGSQREVQPLHKLQHIQQRWLPSKFTFTVIFFSFFFSWIFSKLEFNLISITLGSLMLT